MKKLFVTLVVISALVLSLCVSCTSDKLSRIVVSGPDNKVQAGKTIQLEAIGLYGTKPTDITSKVAWTILPMSTGTAVIVKGIVVAEIPGTLLILVTYNGVNDEAAILITP
jgi:hypothetical protein